MGSEWGAGGRTMKPPHAQRVRSHRWRRFTATTYAHTHTTPHPPSTVHLDHRRLPVAVRVAARVNKRHGRCIQHAHEGGEACGGPPRARVRDNLSGLRPLRAAPRGLQRRVAVVIPDQRAGVRVQNRNRVVRVRLRARDGPQQRLQVRRRRVRVLVCTAVVRHAVAATLDYAAPRWSEHNVRRSFPVLRSEQLLVRGVEGLRLVRDLLTNERELLGGHQHAGVRPRCGRREQHGTHEGERRWAPRHPYRAARSGEICLLVRSASSPAPLQPAGELFRPRGRFQQPRPG